MPNSGLCFHISSSFHPEGNFTVRPFEHHGYRVSIFPPVQGKGYTKPNVLIEGLQAIDDFREAIQEKDKPSISASWMDGETPTIWANLLLVEFQKKEFPRDADENHPEKIDPPIEFVFTIVNEFLERLRSLMQACKVRPLDPGYTPWRLTYLEDDRSPLSTDTRGGGPREFVSTGVRFSADLMTPSLWDAMQTLPSTYKVPVWDTLILDAEDLVDEPHASIVLLSAALEAFIAEVLDRLASRSQVPTALWDWINDRGFFLKNPSFEEQCTTLLEIFSGKSLEDFPKLIRDIRELRQARNSLVHTGKLQVRKTTRKQGKQRAIDETLTMARVRQIIASAKEFVDTVESLLPAEEHRYKHHEHHKYLLKGLVKELPTGSRGSYRIERVIPRSG